MPDATSAPSGLVTVRFFAAAREAAGRAETAVGATTLAGVIAALGANQALAAVLERSTFLVDGTRRTQDDPSVLEDGATVDVLPPFASG